MRKANITPRNDSPTTNVTSEQEGAASSHAPLEPMLRLDQVLALLGCSRSTFYKGIDEGRYPPPQKNGRIAIWPTATIRGWMADPSNFQSFVAAKSAAPRGIGRSAVFGSSVDKMVDVERKLEAFVLTLLHAQYEQFCAVNKPSTYDVKAAAAVKARIAELQAGAAGSIPLLKRWRPSARA